MSAAGGGDKRNPQATVTQVFQIDDSKMARDDFGADAVVDDSFRNWGFTIRRCFVEFIGDLIFIFVGSLSFTLPGAVGPVGPALAHGFTIALLIASMGHISGGHFNPAVTLGIAVSGNIHPVLALFYMLSQLLGGFVGALLVRAAMLSSVYCDIAGGTTNINPANVQVGNAILIEILLTYVLVQTVLIGAVDNGGKNVLAALAIGLAVLVDICAGGDKSGASMNPARSFGPALAYSMLYQNVTTLTRPLSHPCTTPSQVWDHHYVHWVGPIIGGVIAGILFKVFLARDEKRYLFKH